MDLDPDSDPAIFVTDLQDANKKVFFYKSFSAYYFLKGHILNFSNIKVKKKSQSSKNQGFFYYFCLVIEGSESITLANGFGSERLKNIRIRRIRSRILNTA
jgi:hypothetical protein